MLVVIGILLIFCAVVRRKWRDAAAKKEEILRLVAMASEEEAELAKRQKVDVFESLPPNPPPQLQQRNLCAVCLCPTTTRCSQCKAVRYCSGKCQIIHWRKGHKYECQPATLSYEGNDLQEASPNRAEMLIIDEVNLRLVREYETLDSRKSSDSALLFSSSREQSETSLDSSISEFHDSDSPIGPSQTSPDGINSHCFQGSSESDGADAQIQSTLHGNSGSKLEGDETKKTYSSYSSTKTLPSSESERNQALEDSGDVMKSFYLRGSGKRQIPEMELKNSYSSRSANITSSVQHWKNQAHMSSGREARSVLYKSPGNDQMNCRKSDGFHSFVSETEPKFNSKGLKTSVRKFVENFKTGKQSNSYSFDIAKGSTDTCFQQVVVPKIFPQLYSCNDVEIRPFGLSNCGNSCYANAVLQCLVFTRPLAAYFLQGLHSKTCRKKDWCLICEFEHLIQKGQGTNYPLSPGGILSRLRRIGSHLSLGRQEDAHDFLRHIVEKMQSIWVEEAGFSGSMSEDSTLLGLSFGGYLQSKIECMKCSERSKRRDRVMDLAVEIHGNIDTLEEALAQFTKSETLGGDDKYKCSRCKSYENAKKKLTVVEAPNILTIVLKRFKAGNSEKLNKFVRFHEDLNLAQYMIRSGDKYPIYHLYAVVVHMNMMNDSYSGHYVSYVKDFKGSWFRIDDSKVARVDLEAVLSVEAYMLFYARHTVQIRSSLMNTGMHADHEAISGRTITKSKSSNAKPSSHDPKLVHQHSEKHPYRGDARGEHGDWQRSARGNLVLDSSSDNSSIFSASDSGSYSTDSTKDSEISGYIFGSSNYRR